MYNHRDVNHHLGTIDMKKPIPTPSKVVATAPVVPTTETAPVIWDELPRVVNVTHKDTGKAMTVSRAYYLAHAGKLNLA